MYPASFAYHRAESVEDAIARLEANPEASILSGGHSLIPAMKLRLAMPGEVVDISKLDALKSIQIGDEIRIGAGVTYRDIAAHDELQRLLPILPEAIGQVGDMQVRARGTFGGSIAHADPAADLTAVFMALDGRVKAVSSSGEREIGAEELFVDLWTTSLEPAEVITDVILPKPSVGTGMAYVKHAHPASGYAVVGLAAVVVVEDGAVQHARIVVTGATSKPTRLSAVEDALIGAPVNEDALQSASVKAPEGVEINGDPYADEEYRAQLMRVLTRQALERATA
jgi:aerobic carbon-monoxide dehydrogenase medium subunit